MAIASLSHPATARVFSPPEKARNLYRERKEYISGFTRNNLKLAEFDAVNKKFFQLNKENEGETYLNELRQIIPPHKWHKGRSWADYCFLSRPAIYYVITWYKWSLVVSLLKSPEGTTWLNRSYSPLPPRSRREACISEYPLHTAVKKVCHLKCSKKDRDQSIRIVHTLLDLQADVNQADSLGQTPLHVAVTANNRFMIQLLIERGALAVDVDNCQISLSGKDLCILFGMREKVLKHAQEILLDSTPLPKVVTTIALKYLY